MLQPKYIWLVGPIFIIATIYNHAQLSANMEYIEGDEYHLGDLSSQPILAQTPGLANPSSNKIQESNEKNNIVIPTVATHPGAHYTDGALSDDNRNNLQLWSGDASRSISNIPELPERSIDSEIKIIELVIAYCRADLMWIYDDVLNDVPNQKEATVKMTILSKCNEDSLLPRFIDDHRVKEVTLIKLANVGGCDYAYAHFINQYISKASPDDADSSLILFTKDTSRTMDNFHFAHHSRYRKVSEMMEVASRGEFICGIRPKCYFSPFHDTAMLEKFEIYVYVRIVDKKKGMKPDRKHDMDPNRYKNLGTFHKRALNWTFPNKDLTQVCYGGTFAVPASRLLFLSNESNERQALKLIEENLARNTSFSVEEHFMERTWAGLLSNSLDETDTALIRRMQRNTNVNVTDRYGIWGGLLGNFKLTCL